MYKTAGVGHPQTVVMKLLDGLDGCCRTVVADNYFTSISLVEYLLNQEVKFLKKTLVVEKCVDFRTKIESN